jgi:hypothetical protein
LIISLCIIFKHSLITLHFMKLYANCKDFMINYIYLNFVLKDKI